MGLFSTLSFITSHPLSQHRKLRALARFLRWQVGSRLVSGPVAVNYVNDSRLLVLPGMKGATGNVYVGLHEFIEMSFLLHLLRKDDLFVDIGANVGSFTVLAASVIKAKCIAVEPISTTFNHLVDNINLNGVHQNVKSLNIGVARQEGVLRFTSTLDTENHVVLEPTGNVDKVDVVVKRLDDILDEHMPTLVKIDVEGYQNEVLAGAGVTLSKDSLLAVIVEVDAGDISAGAAESELHNTMTGNGFVPITYSPFMRKVDHYSEKEFATGNMIYVKGIENIMERVKSAPNYSVVGRSL